MAEKTKCELIFEAATAVFAEKGFYAATVEEIAARAGIGKGTVYEYFPSKKALFRAMLREGMASYLTAVRVHQEASASIRETLTRIAFAHVSFATEKADLARLLTDEWGGITSWARDWLAEMRELKLKELTRLMARGVEREEFRPVDPRLAAEVYLGFLAALFIPFFLSNYRSSEATAVSPELRNRLQEGLDILFHGLMT